MSDPEAAPFDSRLDAVRRQMVELGVDVTLLSVGPDLPWLCGYEAMPLERLTMLVVPIDATPTLVVPGLEAPRVREHAAMTLRPWNELENPIDLVVALIGDARHAAIGDTTWARFLVELQAAAPRLSFRRAIEVTGPLRAVKDTSERAMLHRAGAAVDTIAAELQSGTIALVGRTEAEISAELGRRILETGHSRANFAIVASGPNAASPHHDAGPRRVEPGDVVLCDFGGTMFDDWGVGYCSDITRCVWVGEPSTEASEIYEVLQRAQAAGVRAATVGTPCEDVDRAVRGVIDDAGWGEYFIHRTGHGIGVEAHEDPYIVEGNTECLVDGHVFSVEPGIYLPGRFGFRLEDCVVATDAGPDPLNRADHALVSVSG